MQFALLGDHPDGLAMARALVESGRHAVIRYSGPAAGAAALRDAGANAPQSGDLEEVLADPAVEAVIVAGSPDVRPTQLRRALQSERHVLCVFPPDHTPDLAYEAAMIQGDTKRVLLPLLIEGLHPALGRLKQLIDNGDGPLGALFSFGVEREAPGSVLIPGAVGARNPSVPGWDILRVLRGEIAEVWGYCEAEELDLNRPLCLGGRFERGGLLHGILWARQRNASLALRVVGFEGQADLTFPTGSAGAAQLVWYAGETRSEEAWEPWSPWPLVVQHFEALLAGSASPVAGPTWSDAIRALELDDAVRRSVERRRASALEYPEATEEVSFKGTMTLVGCGLLWGLVLLLVLSRWIPWLGWVVVPLLVLFLALQLLRWIVPKSKSSGKDPILSGSYGNAETEREQNMSSR